MVVTPIYAAILGLMVILLGVLVIRQRYRASTALGHGEDFMLQRRIRAHANFVEYTPLFLILLALAEWQAMSMEELHALGSVFVLGRISHAYSLLARETYENGRLLAFPLFRSAGMVCTFTPIGVISIQLLIHSLFLS